MKILQWGHQPLPARGVAGRAQRLARGALLASLLALGGCTGMYMGAHDARPTSSGALDESVLARVDIHTITPQVVYEERTARAEHQALEQARRESHAAPQAADKDYQYRVAPQDVLLVTVWNHPELNNPAGQLSSDLSGRVVAEDGSIFYPYIGKVQAAGRTVESIRAEMARRLVTYLMDPQVDVSVLKYLGQRAYATGEFQKPGPVPITNVPLHVTDLVTQAGGLKEDADLREAVLTHANGLVRHLNLAALYRQGDLSQNLLLQNGDVLHVEAQRYNKIFVLGEVAKPQSLPLPYGDYSLSEALSDAGGLNGTTANGSQVYVLRAGDHGRPQVWHLNANSPDALVLADGFRLQARDVVFVDAAAVTRWARVINQILPSLSGVGTVNTLSK